MFAKLCVGIVSWGVGSRDVFTAVAMSFTVGWVSYLVDLGASGSHLLPLIIQPTDRVD